MKMVLPHTPEGAESVSPGQRPGLLRMIAFCPYRRLADKPLYPGRCPGLRAFGPSART